MSGSKINGDLFIQHMCGRPSKNINGPFDPGKQQVQYYGIDQFRVSNELVSNSGRSIKGSRYVSISWLKSEKQHVQYYAIELSERQ